nr:MAG TPA: hypothetical protein [Caudoviricetes sp.]
MFSFLFVFKLIICSTEPPINRDYFSYCHNWSHITLATC